MTILKTDLSNRFILRYFVRHYIFWILIFFVQRLTFVLYYSRSFAEAGVTRGIESFWHGLQLDLSLAGYFALLPFLVLVIQYFAGGSFFKTFIKWYTFILIILTVIISGSDLGLYENWGVKLNYRAVTMLAHPAEAFETIQSAPLFLLTAIMLAQGFICWLLYKAIMAPVAGWRFHNRKAIQFSISMLVAAAVIITSIRGGVQQIPVNESTAYFCSLPIANHAAVNTTWHLFKSISKNSGHGHANIYSYLPLQEAEDLLQKLYTVPGIDSTVSILKEPTPNIVFIQLESFTAGVVKELGGDSGITPVLSRLIDQGLLFTNIYSSGVRTDQGIIALLSGFPAQPQTSIIYQPDKIEHLPFLSLEFKKKGYGNNFYYGGELGFGRFNTIAHHAGFDRVIGKDDFSEARQFNKWGVDDKSLFEKFANESKTFTQPFFSYVITSSSHEPFTVPMEPVFKGNSLEERFKNACYFTDQSLGELLDSVKNTAWYKHTLFVLVADHGHVLPLNRKFDEPARYHIPLLLFGEALKEEYKAVTINALGSQTDIAGTLAKQLGLNDKLFKWSNDLLLPQRQQFAFYTFDDGFGWLTPGDTVIFDNRAQKILQGSATGDKESNLIKGKAYMQMLYDAFLKY
ncbi:MAG: sulfatase-like hydrolase/transferase [Chitinophagaceae bacterium]|nr:sulfatase-like hydrolase/transferase [Chitinophagaceae bacterium]